MFFILIIATGVSIVLANFLIQRVMPTYLFDRLYKRIGYSLMVRLCVAGLLALTVATLAAFQG